MLRNNLLQGKSADATCLCLQTRLRLSQTNHLLTFYSEQQQSPLAKFNPVACGGCANNVRGVKRERKVGVTKS